jgi:hypothetical protein
VEVIGEGTDIKGTTIEIYLSKEINNKEIR